MLQENFHKFGFLQASKLIWQNDCHRPGSEGDIKKRSLKEGYTSRRSQPETGMGHAAWQVGVVGNDSTWMSERLMNCACKGESDCVMGICATGTHARLLAI